MMNQGLAAQSAEEQMEPNEGQQVPAQGQVSQEDVEEVVEQVVQLLKQGVPPEELLKKGVPMEIIKQAIQIIQAQQKQSANNNTPPQTEGGLAMTLSKS